MLSLELLARGARNGSHTLQVVLETCFSRLGTESRNRRPSGDLILLVICCLQTDNVLIE